MKISHRSVRSLCAVIPAAGRGSRLGADLPKILVEISAGQTIWDRLQRLLADEVQQIHVILSPAGIQPFSRYLEDHPPSVVVTTSIQAQPLGMGDALFSAWNHWGSFRHILVVWGDQVYLSLETIQKTIQLQLASLEKSLTVPLTRQEKPYVEYLLNADLVIDRILQSREGDVCHPRGLADVGTFALSVAELADAWKAYGASQALGAKTGETNFLPFIPYLIKKGWHQNILEVADVRESLGVNTSEDLKLVRKWLSGG